MAKLIPEDFEKWLIVIVIRLFRKFQNKQIISVRRVVSYIVLALIARFIKGLKSMTKSSF